MPVSTSQGIAAAYGACSALGVFFSPMHNVLPFLLLGIGIDDMFVIVQCWDNMEQARQNGKVAVPKITHFWTAFFSPQFF